MYELTAEERGFFINDLSGITHFDNDLHDELMNEEDEERERFENELKEYVKNL